MKKGSITVFLSFILVLLFSFLLTTLEAARIRGATAYLSMLSGLAGDSFLASYYYPLFQNYRLFGVNSGEEGDSPEAAIQAQLLNNLCFGTEGLSGGLLRLQSTEVTELEYETMLSDGGAKFLSQIRQQTVLDGVTVALEELFSEEQFAEAGEAGTIYREQEEALAVTATVTSELIKLMELVDGICMGENGIDFDANGKMQANETFIKQFVTMEQAELKAAFDNAEVFRVISGEFFRADRAAGRIESLLLEVQWLDRAISATESNRYYYQLRVKELKAAWLAEKGRLEEEQQEEEEPDDTVLLELEKELEEAERLLAAEETAGDSYRATRYRVLAEAGSQHDELRKKWTAVQSALEEALKVTEQLEKKQKTAKAAVEAYEAFLEGRKEKLSDELYQVFLQELDKMKLYAGLDERGFSLELIRQSLEADRDLLKKLEPSAFSTQSYSALLQELSAIKSGMDAYTVEGLWFSYGDIVVAEQTWDNVTGFLSDLLTTGVLSLVGISREELSDRSLSGEELPSAGLKKEKLLDGLLECIGEVQELFQNGGIGEVLKSAGNAALDGTALELYCRKYFHSYGEAAPYTKLNYEREYLVFGNTEDKSNLFSMVLYLVAIRTLLCMVMILKQPDRVSRLETLSAGVVGFTGMPVLAAVVKYSVLLLWSVEEALVEVTALLQGKRIAVVGTGTVSYSELFLINQTMIEKKAGTVPDGIGAAYQDYLTVLSLTKGTKEKVYRAMDLIQENMRFRYDDGFRMRNVVTGISFCTKTTLNKLFDTGLFLPAVYEPESRQVVGY